jgi:hypothetical protein
MSDDEDDFMSDKFLVPDPGTRDSKRPTTYADRRKAAARVSEARNLAGRTKSRREREIEAREEGLSKSLFERATENPEASGGKALAMMMRMGFKPGQALGRTEDDEEKEDRTDETTTDDNTPEPGPSARSQHRVEPLPLGEWAGASMTSPLHEKDD